MKISILVTLCFLAWFATQGRLFNISLPALEVEPGANLFGYTLQSGDSGQTPSMLDKLFPSLKDLDLPAIKSAFEKFANGYPDEISDGMSAEQKKQFDEMGLTEGSEGNEEAGVYMPMTTPENKLSEAQNILNRVSGLFTTIKALYFDAEQNVFKCCVYSTVSAAVLLLILFFTRFWRGVRMLTGFLFTFSSLLLIISSVISPVIFFSCGINAWHYASGALFWFPTALLIICAVSYCFLERNFPIWRKLYSSLSYPILSGAAIFLKHFLPL